jgi:hypothetical protein
MIPLTKDDYSEVAVRSLSFTQIDGPFSTMNYLLTMMMFIDCRCPWPEHGSKSQLEGSKRPFRIVASMTFKKKKTWGITIVKTQLFYLLQGSSTVYR